MICKSKSGVFIGKIKKIKARQILDSRGNPTVQVDVLSALGFGRASAPSGASTGKHEALEIRDGKGPWGGKGVLKAIANIEGPIAKALVGKEVSDQEEIDRILCRLDGTENKARLGANATTAVSLACAKCAADEKGIGLYESLSFGRKPKLPAPMMNVINGGKHAGNGISIQEFMIYPVRFRSFSEALRAGAETYHALHKIIGKKYGSQATGIGDEGGFAPPCKATRDALDLLEEAIDEAGYEKGIRIAIDAAATSFYDSGAGKYRIDGAMQASGELLDWYCKIIEDYRIISIEDPFHEEAFEDFALMKKRISGKAQLVADDLTVTNLSRLEEAIGRNSLSALLLKINQIGTLSEALYAFEKCRAHGLGTVVSHRSGETEDASIADLAVGIGCGQIKAGAPCRGERTAKYNRLLEIEECMKKPAFAAEMGIVL